MKQDTTLHNPDNIRMEGNGDSFGVITARIIIERYPRVKGIYADGEGRYGVRVNGTIRWYSWKSSECKYVWTGSTLTPQGAKYIKF
jgi:hypothetical protein